jgi:beta-lactamase regulating signal transducer with metallopeptidase domain
MIDLLLRSVVLSFAGVVALAAARRTSASMRHFVTFASLGSLLLLPLFGRVLPPVKIPVLSTPNVQVSIAPPEPSTIKAFSEPSFESQPAEPVHEFGLQWIFGAGSVLVLSRILLSYVRLLIVVRRAKILPAWDRVFESDEIEMPMSAWVGRCFILLPSNWREWSEERLELVFRHERAHIRRGDLVSLVVGRLALAMYWFNPLVWLLVRAEASLAELATDDLVLSEGIPAWRYAEELLAIAQGVKSTGPLLALSMARKAEVARRVEMVLRQGLPRKQISSWVRGVVLAAAVMVAVPMSSWALGPQEKSAPVAQTSAKWTQLILACKIMKTPPMGGKRVTVAESIVDARPKETQIILEPTVLTLPDMEASISTTLNGNREFKLKLTPRAVEAGKYELALEVQEMKKGKWATEYRAKANVAPKEYMLVNFRKEPKASYLVQVQLLVQGPDQGP